jgi:hypothetical protein
MTLEIGGAGALGVATEAVYGTFIAPTKWIPIRSESLTKPEDKIYRTNIRGVADRTGAIQGYYHVEGDVEMEVSADIAVYFLYAGRFTPTKTGASAPFTYTFTPAHVAQPSTATTPTTRKSLSLLIHRVQRPFGYTGVNVSQYAFRVDNGMLLLTASLFGLEEAQQTLGTPTWGTMPPFGPQHLSLELPTASPRTDIDSLEFTINDNMAAANRIKAGGGRAPSYNLWGEREITLSFEADFDALTDYNAYLAQTQQSMTFKASEDALDNELAFVFAASIRDSYEVNLSSLGDTVRASQELHGIYGTTDALVITAKTTESIGT